MANQQVGVNMKFTADTSQAKNQIQTLQAQLTQAITAASKSDFALNKQLQEAISSAAELKSMLTAATNVNTGNLDLSKFSESLSRSESSLKDYAKQLIELGPAGEQAFMTLAKSVVSAEVPVKRTSALLSDIFVTLKNTAKWQISSNIMHGFEGALKSAYGYAQDLNKSLNDIRIVTGASVEDMARFAEQANKSAKALSTATTDYTNASLIYYQQGLSDSEVQERTDITIKMANAAGQSAEIVSDQMTAVWNNFDNGSKSLEYYADVMTALGAATASSTDEIAAGIEKFAAISETVGLSYEYATAALATVTDKTRQSADVVGTAFKTMFARIQGLKLGETLEDGTDFNQYSEALLAVGVNIKDANGELKGMDNILNEMAAVWETLNRDEQVALAQKVAGVRQYNQLMSLMENWDAMEMNLEIAINSEGTLQEQADIYAESWEASRDRVTAAAEDIYTKLLDEDFFIGVNSLLEDILGGFSHLIDVMGGLPGILTSIGAIATKVFGNQISNSINNLIYNIGVFTGAAEDSANVLREEMKGAIDVFNKGLESGSSKGLEGEVLKQEIDRTYELQTKVSSLTEEQRQYAQELIKIETQYGKNAVAAQQAAEAASQAQGSQARQMRNSVVDQAAGMETKDGDKLINDFERTQQYMVKTSQSAVKLKSDIEKALSGNISGNTIIKILETSMQNLKGNSKTLNDTIKNVNAAIDQYKIKVKEAGDNSGKKSAATKKLKEELAKLGLTEEKLHQIIQETAEEVRRSHPDMEIHTEDWINCGEAAANTTMKEEEAANAETLYQQRIAETTKKLQQGKLAIQSYGQAFVKGAQGLSSLLFGLNSLKSIFDTLNDEDLSGFEKITTVMTQLTMAIPAIISGFSNLGSAVKLVNEAHKTGNASIFAYLLGLKAENLENQKGGKITLRKALANKLETASTDQNTISKTANLFITKLLNLETMAFYAALLLIVAVIGAVAAGIYLLVNKYNEAENATKRATEQAKIAAEQYEKVKTKYDELKKSLEDYEDARDAIKYLVEGTDEWKESIVEANDKALELIDTYDELQGKYHYNADTKLIEFDEGALEDLKNNQKTIVDNQYANKVVADNSVKMAENKSTIVHGSRENDPTYMDNLKNTQGATVGAMGGAMVATAGMMAGTIAATAGAALIPILAGALIGAVAVGVETLFQRANNDEQQEALSNLADAFVESGENYIEAYNSLNEEDQKLIDSLGYTQSELRDLCSELAKNTYAIHENNKAIIDNQFTGQKEYDNNQNKQFLNEVLSDDLKKYQDQAETEVDGYSKEEVQEQYAKAMGYSFVEKKGDSAVYADEQGETVTIGYETARAYLAQQKAMSALQGNLSDTSQKVNELAKEEKSLAAQYGDSVLNYDEYKKALIESGKELGFSQQEVEEYVKDFGTNQRAAAKDQLSSKFQNLGYDKYNSDMTVESFSQGLSDEQLKMASGIDFSSVDDFFRQFEEKLYDNILTSLQSSADSVQDIIAQASEDGSFSIESINFLEQDKNFLDYLEETGQDILDFTYGNYTERMRIATSYYTDLKAAENEALQTSKANYEADLAEYQAILDYKRAMEEGDGDTAASIQESFDKIDFEAYMDMDISEVEDKMDEVQDRIDELDGQQIKLDMEWETTDAIEESMKQVGSFTQLIENDTKKVGNTYQMTAAQAREWMEVYPELFSQADITTDGLISLNKDYVDTFIDGQEQSTDAAIEANIQQLEARLHELEGERAACIADLELAEGNARGKEALAAASSEYLADTRAALVQYYMDLGYDETAANAAALHTMGLNEAEYSELVANASKRNAENQIEASEQGATGQAKSLSKLGQKITNWARSAIQVFKNVWAALKGEIKWSDVTSYGLTLDGSNIESGQSVTGINAYDKAGNFQEGQESEIEAVLATVNKSTAADLKTYIAGIDKSIANIKSEINYNKALKAQSLGDYGSEDPTGGKNKGKDKGTDGKKEEKDLEKIAERYHEITKEIEYYEHLLNKLGKLSEAAHGGKKVKLMKEEQKALEQLCKKQEDLLYLQLAFIEVDKQKVQDTFTTEAIFDINGNLTNYTQLVEEATNRLNAAREKYNKSKQEDADKEALEAAEKKYEEELAVLEQYEETVEAARKQEEELIEIAIQLQQKRLDTITYVIDLKVEVDDEELKQLDFLITRLESREFQTAASLQQMQEYFPIYKNQADTAKNGMDRTLGEWLTPEEVDKFYAGQYSDIDWDSKTLPPDFWDKIYEYADNYKEATEAAIQLRTEVYDKLGEAFADLTGEIDKTIEKFDHYSSVMDHYTNIIDLSGAKNQFSKEELKEFNQLKVTNANAKLESSFNRKDSYKTYATAREGEYQKDLKAREDLIAQINSTTDEATKKQLEAQLEVVEGQIKNSKKAWEDAEDAALTANEEYLVAWEEALQASRDAFLANAQLELDALEEQMAGAYGSLEAMQEEFDRNSEINDRYLEDYERIYELTKLNRDLTKKMDETSNIKAKKELAKLQEEILFYQKEGRKMSDYDLEYLQKKYDLRVAELALEEAQNAKTQVRLTRDSEGNYSYTYTADEDSLAEAQQTYEDKLYEITNLSNEHIKEQTQALLSTQQEYINSLAEIHQKAAEGQYKTTEDYQQALDSCTAYYVGKMNYHGGEVDKATLNNEIVYKKDYLNYSTYVGEKISESTRLKNQMEADILESEKTTQFITIERQAARDAIHLAFANGLIEDDEAYKKSLADIDKSYEDELAASEQRTLDLIDERNDKYALDFGNYDRETDKKLAAEEGLITSLQNTWLPKFAETQSTGADFVKENFTNPIVGEDGQSGYLGQVKKDFDKMNENIATNMTSAGIKLNEAGDWVDGFKTKVDEDLISGEDSVTKGIEETSLKIDTLIDSLTGENGLTTTASGIHTWATSITTDLANMITEYENLSTAVLQAKTDMAQEAEEELDEEEEEKCPICGKLLKDCKGHKNKNNNNKNNNNKNNNNNNNKTQLENLPEKTQKGIAYSIWSGYWGNGDARKELVNQKLGKNAYKTYQNLVNKYDIAVKAKNGSWEKDLFGKYLAAGEGQKKLKNTYGPSAFFTGGYTGVWGPNGKLAILHEKELVLNKEDTSNMFKIISMVRDLSSILDLQAYQSSLAQSTAATLGSISNYQDAFEQTVTIHAEFPDAIYASEIETALNNLVNSASQFANRKY